MTIKDVIAINQEVYFDKQFFNWKSVWTGAKGDTQGKLSVTIPAHDVLVLRLTPKK
jgi:alpha-galactosidase